MKKTVVSLLLLVAVAILLFFQRAEEGSGGASGPSQRTEIRFWFAFSDDARSGWIKNKAEEWNRTQGEYKVIAESKGSYRETLQAAILGARQGVSPHLVHIFEVGSQLALDSGLFEPLENLGPLDMEDYIEPVLNYYTINGVVNSLPFNSSSPILYTNKTLMAKVGLDPENPPETFEGILAASEQARKVGLEVAGLGFNLHSWFFEQWLAEQGALIVNQANGRVGRATETLLDSEAALKVFRFIKELNDRGFYKYSGKAEDWRGSDAIFQEGKVLFHITSTADLGNILAAVDGRFELGTGRLPIPEDSPRNGVVIGGASIWLTRGKPLEEQKMARDFVLFLTNTENMIEWHKLTGYYPVRKSSVEKLREEGWFEENPARTVAFTQLLETLPSQATAGGLMGSFRDTRTIVIEAFQKILNGADVVSTAENAKELADLRLAEYNKNF